MVCAWGLALDQRLFVPVIDPYVNFVMAWNTGINFGLFGSDNDWMRWVLDRRRHLGICAVRLSGCAAKARRAACNSPRVCWSAGPSAT